MPSVDAFDAAEYQQKLKQGVAHAKGSAFPDQKGRIFIFAHSGSGLLPGGVNPEFNLLDKLAAGDPIYIFYQGRRFDYVATDQKKIDPNDVEFFGDESELVLMTCWPPGTTLERLIIRAVRKKD
jgi:sortase A